MAVTTDIKHFLSFIVVLPASFSGSWVMVMCEAKWGGCT